MSTSIWMFILLLALLATVFQLIEIFSFPDNYDNFIITERKEIKKGQREEEKRSEINTIREYLNAAQALIT